MYEFVTVFPNSFILIAFCMDPSIKSALLLATNVPFTKTYPASGILSLASTVEVDNQALNVPVKPAAPARDWHLASAPVSPPKLPLYFTDELNTL